MPLRMILDSGAVRSTATLPCRRPRPRPAGARVHQGAGVHTGEHAVQRALGGGWTACTSRSTSTASTRTRWRRSCPCPVGSRSSRRRRSCARSRPQRRWSAPASRFGARLEEPRAGGARWPRRSPVGLRASVVSGNGVSSFSRTWGAAPETRDSKCFNERGDDEPGGRRCVSFPRAAGGGSPREATPVGGPRQRALLALLLIRAGEVVPTDRLVDELWGSTRRRPRLPVAELRCPASQAAAGRPSSDQGAGLPARVSQDQVDAGRFEELVRTARAQKASRAGGDSARGARALARFAARGLRFEQFAVARSAV